MIAFDPNSLCVQAEPHYYDFLFGKGDEPTPEHIVRHIEECQSCQEQLNQLKAALSQADSVDTEQSQANSAIGAMLRLHFAYIGKPVTCQIVKPFLPTLLYPVLQVRVPTPITAHLDNCQQCSEDLNTIHEMNLNRKQLGRLSRLFAENPPEDAVKCSEAQVARLAAGLLVFQKANAETLKHICTCSDCRKALYQYRHSVREDLLRHGEIQVELSCEYVSSADIFDYCVPYGIDPAADQYAEFRESLVSHLRSCPACLAKMQELHSVVYGIAERANSQVVTTYHIDESAKAQAAGESDDLYAGFPIRVEIADCKDQAKLEKVASTVSFAAALKQRVSAINVKPLAKIAAVAAAILIAATLLLNTPTAKAVTIEQIYEAIEKIKNVYIAKSASDRPKLTQELWVSRELSIYMTKTEKETVLWDIGSRIRRMKHTDTGAVETIPLTEERLAGIERKMSGYLGLVPFTNISVIPADAKWRRIANVEAVPEGIEVYDLTWIGKKHINFVILNKWRVFVDAKTNLPYRTEFHRKLSDDSEYILESTNLVEYLRRSEIQGVLKAAAF